MERAPTTSEPIDILILSAHLPELAGLGPLLGPELKARVGGHRVVAKPVGIGLSAAARGTASRLASQRPRAAILVGTSGAYEASGLGIGEVVVVERTRLASTASTEGRAEFPAPMSTLCELDPNLSRALGAGRLRGVDAATTLAVTVDDALARTIATSLRCAVEHLEAFAVAECCAAEGVPLAILLGVANRVGRTAREEWRLHHRTAGAAATAHVAAWLEQGAPGLV
jgi:nucleoside phosphorylase